MQDSASKIIRYIVRPVTVSVVINSAITDFIALTLKKNYRILAAKILKAPNNNNQLFYMQKKNLPHVSIIQIQAINAFRTNRFQRNR